MHCVKVYKLCLQVVTTVFLIRTRILPCELGDEDGFGGDFKVGVQGDIGAGQDIAGGNGGRGKLGVMFPWTGLLRV